MSDISTVSPQWLGASGHYENFPVASILVPARIRPAIVSVYRFARYADDVADEGDATAPDRVAELDRMDRALTGVGTHPMVAPLLPIMATHGIGAQPFSDLLDAFRQDASGFDMPDRLSVMDYCRRSANPVGRIVLQLFSVTDPLAHRQSDRVCSALQLINFAQDIGQDTARGRCYVPADEMASHGVTLGMLQDCTQHGRASPAVRALLSRQLAEARTLLDNGAALLCRVPARLRLELAGVLAGGYQTIGLLERHDPFSRRLKLGKRDALPLLKCALGLLIRPPRP